LFAVQFQNVHARINEYKKQMNPVNEGSVMYSISWKVLAVYLLDK